MPPRSRGRSLPLCLSASLPLCLSASLLLRCNAQVRRHKRPVCGRPLARGAQRKVKTTQQLGRAWICRPTRFQLARLKSGTRRASAFIRSLCASFGRVCAQQKRISLSFSLELCPAPISPVRSLSLSFSLSARRRPWKSAQWGANSAGPANRVARPLRDAL